jgi:hypothetical protein
LQLVIWPHVGAPPSGVPPEVPLDDAPLEVAPLDEVVPPDDAPLEVVPLDDASLGAPLDAPEEEPAPEEEEEPAPEELEAPLPDDVPAQGELQLCSAHWITPLQSRLEQLEPVMHMLSADEQRLLTHVLHIVLGVMPVTTETKASGSLQPLATSLDPPLPPFFEAHATAELNEPAISAVHTTALVILASSTSHIKLRESRWTCLGERAQFNWLFRPIPVLNSRRPRTAGLTYAQKRPIYRIFEVNMQRHAKTMAGYLRVHLGARRATRTPGRTTPPRSTADNRRPRD